MESTNITTSCYNFVFRKHQDNCSKLSFFFLHSFNIRVLCYHFFLQNTKISTLYCQFFFMQCQRNGFCYFFSVLITKITALYYVSFLQSINISNLEKLFLIRVLTSMRYIFTLIYRAPTNVSCPLLL